MSVFFCDTPPQKGRPEGLFKHTFWAASCFGFGLLPNLICSFREKPPREVYRPPRRHSAATSGQFVVGIMAKLQHFSPNSFFWLDWAFALSCMFFMHITRTVLHHDALPCVSLQPTVPDPQSFPTSGKQKGSKGGCSLEQTLQAHLINSCSGALPIGSRGMEPDYLQGSAHLLWISPNFGRLLANFGRTWAVSGRT